MNTSRYLGNTILRPALRLYLSRRPASSPIIDPPEDDSIKIPRPKYSDHEPLSQKKARLVYQSRKRGMLENDLLLSTFVYKHLDTFTEAQLNDYDKLINGPTNDWDLYYWATEIKETPQEYQHDVMDLLKTHCKNLNRESRLRQPDLK